MEGPCTACEGTGKQADGGIWPFPIFLVGVLMLFSGMFIDLMTWRRPR